MNKSTKLKIALNQKNRLKSWLGSNPEFSKLILTAEERSFELGVDWMKSILDRVKEANPKDIIQTQDFQLVKYRTARFFERSRLDDHMLVALNGYSSRFDELGNFYTFPDFPLMAMRTKEVSELFNLLSKNTMHFFACASLDGENICFFDSSVGDTQLVNPDIPVYRFYSAYEFAN